MSIRNNREIGENLQKIVSRLMANDNLIKLLYYTDKDPLAQPPLTDEQKQKEIFDKLIRIIPRVGPKETATSIIAIRVVKGEKDLNNSEFKNIVILKIQICVPLQLWEKLNLLYVERQLMVQVKWKAEILL